jgi:hypothetical protein
MMQQSVPVGPWIRVEPINLYGRKPQPEPGENASDKGYLCPYCSCEDLRYGESPCRKCGRKITWGKKHTGQWVFLPGLLSLTLLTVAFYEFSKSAPPLELEVKWVFAIFALMSSVTLAYVRMLNEMKGRRRILEEGGKKRKLVRLIRMQVWTCTYSFIVIGGLVVRILIALFGKDIPRILDSLIVAAFTIGSFLRVAIFLYSYHDDYLVTVGIPDGS